MKIYNYIKLAIFIAFSVLIIIFREELVNDLHFFVGSIILAFGIESAIVSLLTAKRNAFKSIRFAFSMVEVILGLTLLTAIRHFAHVCVIWSVWSILRQSIDINEVLRGEVKGVVAVIYLIQSVVSVVFSIMLLLDPSRHHAITHVYLLIAELLVISLPPVVEEMLSSIKNSK